MCGIAGIVAEAPQAGDLVLDELLSQLRHRGPDARGVFGDQLAAIGQTRLAVIDLITGDPPLSNESGICRSRAQRRDL